MFLEWSSKYNKSDIISFSYHFAVSLILGLDKLVDLVIFSLTFRLPRDLLA